MKNTSTFVAKAPEQTDTHTHTYVQQGKKPKQEMWRAIAAKMAAIYNSAI